MRAAGVRFGCVLTDAGSGLSASFPAGLERPWAFLGGRRFRQAKSMSGRRGAFPRLETEVS